MNIAPIMPLVIVESPYAGDVTMNVDYGRRALRDCLLRGEAPFASHLLYTQPGVLDDARPEERTIGMTAGFQWGNMAHKVAAYCDLGISGGMAQGIARAILLDTPVQYRWLNSDRTELNRWEEGIVKSAVAEMKALFKRQGLPHRGARQ